MDQLHVSGRRAASFPVMVSRRQGDRLLANSLDAHPQASPCFNGEGLHVFMERGYMYLWRELHICFGDGQKVLVKFY